VQFGARTTPGAIRRGMLAHGFRDRWVPRAWRRGHRGGSTGQPPGFGSRWWPRRVLPRAVTPAAELMTARGYACRVRSVSMEFSQVIRAAGALDRRTLTSWPGWPPAPRPPRERADLYRPAEAGRSAPGGTSAAARV